MSNLNDLSRLITDPIAKDPTKKLSMFSENFNKLSNGILRTVWDYCEQTPQAVFLYVDFEAQDAGALIQLNNNLMNVEKYSLRKKTDASPEERLEMLKTYLRQDTGELIELFKKHHKVVPQRMWVAMDIIHDTLRHNIGFYDSENAEVTKAIKAWRARIAESHWTSLPI